MAGQRRLRTRILLADDHHMVRQGIRQLLEREPDFEVVGEADNGSETVKLARELRPDVVLLEAHISKLDSAETTRRVKSELPKSFVLLLTTSQEEEQIVELIAAGAAGHLLKNASGEELVQAIRSVRAGDFVCGSALAQKVFKRVASLRATVNCAENLTRRELDVLRLATQGLSNRDIAGYLGIGPRTVKHHLMNVFDKMNVRSRTEAVSKAIKHGWVTCDGE